MTNKLRIVHTVNDQIRQPAEKTNSDFNGKQPLPSDPGFKEPLVDPDLPIVSEDEDGPFYDGEDTNAILDEMPKRKSVELKRDTVSVNATGNTIFTKEMQTALPTDGS